MNVLTDELPDAVELDGVVYDLNTDFRAALRTIMAFEDPDLTGLEKQAVMLGNLFRQPPHDMRGAIDLAVKFLNGGQDNPEDKSGPRVYSFSKDAGLIFAAFRQTHGIDLEREEMHWWKFLALFMDLGNETAFCNMVSLRKRVKTGKASKEEKQAAREIGDAFVIEELDNRSIVEREAEQLFMRLVAEGQKARENGARV